MSVRFLLQNGVKLALLLPFLFGASDTVKMLSAIGLVISLVVDYMFYKRDKRERGEDEYTGVEPVPMPPDRGRR